MNKNRNFPNSLKAVVVLLIFYGASEIGYELYQSITENEWGVTLNSIAGLLMVVSGIGIAFRKPSFRILALGCCSFYIILSVVLYVQVIFYDAPVFNQLIGTTMMLSISLLLLFVLTRHQIRDAFVPKNG